MLFYTFCSRTCGKVCLSECCNYKSAVPDLNWLGPERICDNCIGTFSVDPMEDMLLVCSRRSELVASLREQFDLVNAKPKGKKQSGNTSGGHHRRHSTNSSALPLNFSTMFTLRPCGAPTIATRPSDEVMFVETGAKPKRMAARGRGRGAQSGSSATGDLGEDFLEECGIASIEFSGMGPGQFNAAVAGRVQLCINGYSGLPHELVNQFDECVDFEVVKNTFIGGGAPATTGPASEEGRSKT